MATGTRHSMALPSWPGLSTESHTSRPLKRVRSPGDDPYVLRRANFIRLRSFLCLCFRIFLRRFFNTLDIERLLMAQSEPRTRHRASLAREWLREVLRSTGFISLSRNAKGH